MKKYIKPKLKKAMVKKMNLENWKKLVEYLKLKLAYRRMAEFNWANAPKYNNFRR